MHRFTSAFRRPVKRQGAEQYMLFTLLSFAASVTLTRLFLSLAGYPQVGGGEFHIAHVLWGGLLLFIAALLPITIANRWVYTLGAFMAGAGVGLFIDEVGKFITQSNNYFYPLAAPIIYAFFLLVVMLYLRIRRPPHLGPREELYRAFDSLEEVLEHDLDPRERADLERRLHYIAQQANEPELARLANDLMDFLSSDVLKLAPHRSTYMDIISFYWKRFERRWITRLRIKAVLTGGLIALGLIALSNIVLALPVGPLNKSLQRILTQMIISGQISTRSGINWFAARLALETSVGILLLASAGLFIARKDHLAVRMANIGLLISLTMADLLVFYFDQFSSILYASVQLFMLIGVAYYRQRFLIPISALAVSSPADQAETITS